MAIQTQLTQLERAVIYVDGLLGMVDELSDARRHLREILTEAQNAPPYGAADGSISAPQFTDLSRIRNAVDSLIRVLAVAEKL